MCEHGSSYEANLVPPVDVTHYAKGLFNPQKPLLFYATKQVKRSNSNKSKGCYVIGHALFVVIPILTIIVGLGNIFWNFE